MTAHVLDAIGYNVIERKKQIMGRPLGGTRSRTAIGFWTC